MMIMGAVCIRACTFCNVATGKPGALDPFEPTNVGAAVARLGLAHVVITSVDRDDLADGGAGHFAAVVQAIREATPNTTIEVMTPDFLHKTGAEEAVVAAKPDVFNHNLETVPRLYPPHAPGRRDGVTRGGRHRDASLRVDLCGHRGALYRIGRPAHRPPVSRLAGDVREPGLCGRGRVIASGRR